ncbi:recombinase family protein [Shinella sp. PSBB067]|uniref:recombinase family protein n=1 Tax=Shinella sp. PSBB067 TaxID=2715959 RepID=UPI00193B18CD|nr:recombinase family protein [Shinella sp. PSBB067]QRI63765.1 recombinase family protein [Shinella sp. PSBB067]
MKIGYARVSTEDQSLDLQINALRRAGCERIFTDYGLSGRGFDRPGLHEALGTVKHRGTLVVWRLDRLGRSLPKLIELVDTLGTRGVEFQSLTENIDTSSSGGRLLFHIMGALAEFERSLISERTRAGMEAARLKGRHLGRKPSLTRKQVREAIQAISSGDSASAVALQYGISRRTLQRHIDLLNKESAI